MNHNHKDRLYHPQSSLSPAIAVIALLHLALPAALQAAPGASTSASGTSRPAQITVSATETDIIEREVYAKSEQAGRFVIEHEEINMAPSTTGSVNEVLRMRALVQFDQNSRNSRLGGDITPPRVSIGGGRYYENNFLLDGISISNNLDPSGFNSSTSDGSSVAPSGEAESRFIDPDLVGSLTVYTSNVPAEYGAFTGGVISAKIREPRTDGIHLSLKYRHTSDSWARQHYLPGQAGYSTNAASYQPEFTKHEYSLSLETPFSSASGALHGAALLSYTEKRSIIPVYDTTNRAEKHNILRLNRNLLLKLTERFSDDFKASLTTAWIPYEGEYYAQANRRGSRFTAEGGGFSMQLDTENTFSLGLLDTTLSFQHSNLDRDGEGNAIYTWRNASTNAYANWGTSTTAMEGFAGDYTQSKNQFTLKPVFTFNPLRTGWLKHALKAGGEFSYLKFKANHVGSSLYMWSGTSSLNTPTNSPYNTDAVGDLKDGVVTGEQWLNRRSSYAPWHKNLGVTQAAFFVEDTIQLERISFRPGVRVSYDDISNNVDIAPRTLLTVDVLKNNLLNLHAGYNRYYGTQIVNWAMYNNTNFSTETRDSWDQPWTSTPPVRPAASRSLGDLDSPYNDEFSLGAEVNIWKTAFRLEAVKRKHRDQIRSIPDPDGPAGVSNNRKYSNGGKTDYEGLSFEIEKNLNLYWAGKHRLLFTASKSESKTSFRTDLGLAEGANLISPDYAMYNGEIVLKDVMPPNNFNNPWVLALSDGMSFLNDRLRLHNVFRYEKGGDGVFYVGSRTGISPDTLTIYEYVDGHQPSSLYYDLSAEFDLLKCKGGTLTLRVEILNVFDRKILTNTEKSVSGNGTDSYMMGRQLYAGMQYKF